MARSGRRGGASLPVDAGSVGLSRASAHARTRERPASSIDADARPPLNAVMTDAYGRLCRRAFQGRKRNRPNIVPAWTHIPELRSEPGAVQPSQSYIHLDKAADARAARNRRV